MTLVLSMNPFCEHEADGPPPLYRPIWDSEQCSKSCMSSPEPPGGATEELAEESPCRRAPDHVTMSRLAYFKRKYVEDEEPPLRFRSYCQTVAPVLEERAHILRLSLEKMRFIDDPEAFLRRSVLINNLLRRLRTEILLQSDWCFPPGQVPPAPCILPPSTPAPAALLQPPPALRPCFAGPGPYRKRLRLLRAQAPECVPACCCLYTAGRYLHLPFSVYEDESGPQPSSSSSSSSVSALSSFPQLLPLEDGDSEDELDALCPGLDLSEASGRLPREARERPRTRERCRELAEGERIKERERRKERGKAEAVAGGHSRWISDTMETGAQGPLAWSQVGRK